MTALPRDTSGKVRTEILQLVAMNQVDLIPPLLTTDAYAKQLADADSLIQEIVRENLPRRHG